MLQAHPSSTPMYLPKGMVRERQLMSKTAGMAGLPMHRLIQRPGQTIETTTVDWCLPKAWSWQLQPHSHRTSHHWRPCMRDDSGPLLLHPAQKLQVLIFSGIDVKRKDQAQRKHIYIHIYIYLYILQPGIRSQQPSYDTYMIQSCHSHKYPASLKRNGAWLHVCKSRPGR